MNNIIKKFEAFDSSYYSFLDTKPTYEKIAVFEKQDPNTIVYADRAVQVRFLNFTAAWQAATEQSQKEIAGLEAKLNELVKFQSSADRLAKAQAESLNTIAELQAREKELVNLAKLTYGYLWHINAGLDAPAILNVTSITPEKCSRIVRKLWLDVLTKEQRGEGINKALEALATVRGE